MPAQYFSNLLVRFRLGETMTDAEIVRLLKEHNFSIGKLAYRVNAAADFCEYQIAIRSHRAENASSLAESLKRLPAVREFEISPTGN
jgi:putative Mg2+ transporter-C (MgtC) family protein